MDEFELVQGQSSDAAVILMFNEAFVAIRGAQDTDGVSAVGLDFEMNRGSGFHDGYTILIITPLCQYTISICMATKEMQNHT